MNRNDRVWAMSNTGGKRHAFVDFTSETKNHRRALCSKRITRNGIHVRVGLDDFTGYDLCQRCALKFNTLVKDGSPQADESAPTHAHHFKTLYNMGEGRAFDRCACGEEREAFAEDDQEPETPSLPPPSMDVQRATDLGRGLIEAKLLQELVEHPMFESVADPVGEAEEHVNQVLGGIRHHLEEMIEERVRRNAEY